MSGRRLRGFFDEQQRLNGQAAAVGFQEAVPASFPMCGTLLGLVRDRDLIRHDSDIDFGVFESDWPAFWPTTLGGVWRTFTRKDRYHHYGLESEIVWRHHSGIKVDCFKLFESELERWWVGWGDEFPRHAAVIKSFPRVLTDSFVPLNLWGTRFRIFRHAEAILQINYGDDWRVPDPTWSYHKK
jgi:hypothetical protein